MQPDLFLRQEQSVSHCKLLTQFSLQLQGWSRNFAQTMHAWSQEGKGGYLEEFVPSLAASKKLASVGVANDEYYGPRYFPVTWQCIGVIQIPASPLSIARSACL